jgi:glutamate racemase
LTARVLVVDSGIGGLSVAREIRLRAPRADIIYVADDAAFPYGERSDDDLTTHVVALVERLAGEVPPDIVVIACNTASTLVLPPLRARLTMPIVGTVPAIKPAAVQTRTGLLAVLATPGTIERDYTRALIATHAPDRHVRLVGSFQLAAMAEAHMRGEQVDVGAVRAEIEAAFFQVAGARCDTIVLGCTHYVFMLEVLKKAAVWPVEWIDSARAIARRAVSLLPDSDPATASGPGGGTAVLTSGKSWPAPFLPLLTEIGLLAEQQ